MFGLAGATLFVIGSHAAFRELEASDVEELLMEPVWRASFLHCHQLPWQSRLQTCPCVRFCFVFFGMPPRPMYPVFLDLPLKHSFSNLCSIFFIHFLSIFVETQLIFYYLVYKNVNMLFSACLNSGFLGHVQFCTYRWHFWTYQWFRTRLCCG